MLFNSIEFGIFIPIVFLLYWFVANRSLNIQNGFLVVVSYVFYGWWDWRFLLLIMFSCFVDYFVGKAMSKTEKEGKRTMLLLVSISVNLGLLGFFKYYNFFIENFVTAFTFLGKPIEANRLDIVLPIGISFYTFQTLSYSIDVYKRRLIATKNIVSFFAFVSFFPQLVAGPIERAINLLPQFHKERKFNYGNAADGMRQILWGLFKKIVIADNCAVFVNEIFENYADLNGSTLVLGAILFAFQIYADFSGYSDIARLFGFNLMQNFAFPYFSRDIAEFWRRWHISLSTWFRDYLYIPLGGSRGKELLRIRNIFIIFLVSGFWHGANWTFLVWGFLNAIYFLPLMLLKTNRKNLDTVSPGKILPSAREFIQILVTFGLTVFAWIFFRSESIGAAFAYIDRMTTLSTFGTIQLLSPKIQMLYTILLILLLIMQEWRNRDKKYGLILEGKSRLYRWLTYIGISLLIITFGYFGKNEFIYFQF